MMTIRQETFLSEFLVFDGILGKYCDRSKVVSALAGYLCFTDEEEREAMRLTESKILDEIRSKADFEKYKRIKQYADFYGESLRLSEEEAALLAVKGNVFEKLDTRALLASSEWTESQTFKNLINHAYRGEILSLRVLGILLSEGICLPQNVRKGEKNLLKAAQWGDVVSALALLFRQTDKRGIASIFRATIKNTPCEYLDEVVTEHYGLGEVDRCREVLLIRKAVLTERAEEETCDGAYFKIAFSPALSYEEKERLLLRESKEAIAETGALPLAIDYFDVKIDGAALEKLPFRREKEERSLVSKLANSDLRGKEGYRPVCLVSDSEYLTKRYVEVLKDAFPKAHVKLINVADLDARDVEPTRETIFLRDLHERNANVLIFLFKGRVQESVSDSVKAFLDGRKRRDFRLSVPPISLDLGSVLPICICDKENAKHLGTSVEKVLLAPPKREEMPEIVRDILRDRSAFYEIAELQTDRQVEDGLIALSAENAERAIDSMIRENREGIPSPVTWDFARPYIEGNEGESTAFGFGGNFHEIR